MSREVESQPKMPGISTLELVLSLLAIAITAFVLNILGGIALSLVAIVVFGQNAVTNFGQQIKSGMLSTNQPAYELLNFGLMILIYTTLGLAIWLVAKFRPKMPFTERVAWRDWDGDRQFWWLAVGVGPLYGLISGWLLGLLEPQSEQWLKLPTHFPAIGMAFLVIVILGPAVEELLFRGWIFTGLRSRLPFGLTALITATLFALAHYESTFTYAIAVFPMGLLLSYVRERYGTIKATIVVHGLFNLFAMAMNYLGAG